MTSDPILSSIKDTSLVEKRRNQIISGALTLFKEKGFHRTTTREIAKESGFSIGTLYEYIRTKEDVLYLVYEAINDHVYKHLEKVIDSKESSIDNLVYIIESYYRLMDEMQEEVIILYQEVKSLQTNVKEIVLQKEREMVLMLKRAIMTCVSDTLSEEEIELIANNIFVQGHMWGFRRWMLHRQFTIDKYIEMQTTLILQSLCIDESPGEKAPQ
ncbi:TetR/AcrR family transcriptional regulator [Pseudogracilibacillus sp. SE30717A]|uniref:TetR/AcrR family transcriptional regulator n=1 Tax=Pseudogracilibacillus sp. SE30717A TaxID=3098293 RepID=UPI00300DDEB0